MKTIFLALICNLTLLSQNIKLNSESSYIPYDNITLNDYKSVQLRDNNFQSEKLSLGIAISGGGSRAQYFSVGVLLGLENIQNNITKKDFLNEIDYYSTVSGGCYSAGYYLSLKANGILKNISFNNFYYSDKNIYDDYVFKSATALDILNNYANETGSFGSMAKILDYQVLQFGKPNIRRLYLEDFFIDKNSSQNVEMPMFVTNATIWNNGERFAFMPHIIKSAKITNADRPNAEIFEKDFNGYKFPLTHAITASSAFPGVLPKTKFILTDTDKTGQNLVMIDGGAVDNLGYKTLVDLLSCDSNEAINKHGLIIDCSGEGKLSQTSPQGNINIIKLLGISSLLTVQTRYMSFETESNMYFQYKIPKSKSEIISFGTLKNYLDKLPKNDEYFQYIKYIKSLKDKNKNWFSLYTDFKDKLVKRLGEKSFYKQNDRILIGSLNFKMLDQLTPEEILLIYEYSSQVITKLKIYEDEGEMLILAGKLAVFINKDKLENLLIIK